MALFSGRMPVNLTVRFASTAVGVVVTTNLEEACTGVDVAVMVGGFPRREGMERKDVMGMNVKIYK